MLAARFRKLRMQRRRRIAPEVVEVTDLIAWKRKKKIEPQLDAHDRLPPGIRRALVKSDAPFEANHMLDLIKNGIPSERIIQAIEVEGKKRPPGRGRGG